MRTVLTLVAFLGLGCFPFARAEEAEVVTARMAWEPGRFGLASANKIPFGDRPPPDTTLPTGLTNPRYARIRMAGTRGLAIALDAQPASPRLWVDHDFDGDLAKEKRIWMKASGTAFRREQTVLVRYKPGETPTRVTLHFTYLPQNGDDYMTVYAAIHRRGTVVLGGRLRLMALADGNSDVRFDDAEKDALYVDLDGNGRFEAFGAAPDRVTPGVPFRVGNEGYVARITDPSGQSVEFTRTKEVPPAKQRTWPTRGTSRGGWKRAPPPESLDVLAKRFEKEKGQPYNTRYQTVNLIGNVGSEAAFRLLQDIAVEDKDKNIRLAGIRAMGQSAYLEIGGDYVLQVAAESDATLQGAAAVALHGMGHPKRFDVYVRLVQSGQASAVSGAISYLAYIRTPASDREVMRAYKDAASDNIRYLVYVNGLRNLAAGPPVKTMLAAVDGSYPSLRAAALTDLQLLGHPKARVVALELSKERPVVVNVGQAVAGVLGAAGDRQSVKALLALYEDERLPAQVQTKILEQLRFLRAPEAIDVLVASLRSKSAALRAAAAEILAGVAERRVTDALLKQAKREKDEAAKAAQLEALGDHGDAVALKLLLKIARKRGSKDPTKKAGRQAAIRALGRLGLGHKDVRAFFLKLLGSRYWPDRVLALDAAERTGDPKLIPDIVENLDHAAWQVRLAAISALDGLRVKACIPPLIARLETEEVGRIRDALADALFRLTGQMLYDDAGVWAKWWAKDGAGFEVPATIPEAIDTDVGGTDAGFYGIPVRTDRVVFVIDQSGSMSAKGADAVEEGGTPLNRLDVAVREVLAAIGKLGNRARVNVILFHTTIHPWKKGLPTLGGKGRTALERHLTNKRPTGGTNLYDGLELALGLPDVDTIFLLSDGVPGAGKYIATGDILRAVRRLNQTRRIAIHGISIGMDSELLKRLATENGGKYARR